VITVLNLIFSEIAHSDALRANGFDNFTDILANIALLIGLKMARIPADDDHVYGHWKVESIASLISSFIMFIVACWVLWGTAQNIIHNAETQIDPIGAIAGLISAFIMVGVYLYNRNLSQQVKSAALSASIKDSLADIATSLGAALAVLLSYFHLALIDRLVALLICVFIFRAAYQIFRESTFSLSDGFDEQLIADYRQAIVSVEKVKSVKLLRGRTYGANIFLDVVIEMSPDMSVAESHHTTEIIEKLLQEQFGVYDTDVHVEPAVLPESERVADLSLMLLAREERLLTGEDLRSTDFIEILANGKASTELATTSTEGISHYKARQISRRTFILNYETAGLVVSSIWRRDEVWLCIYRQLTKKA